MASYYQQWPAYVPVAQRRQAAAREANKLRRNGHAVAPVQIEGRNIASTVWGKAWCENLESYRGYETRLPRGRSYVRNGSVIDLQIGPREVKALVSGSSIYKVTVGIASLPAARWRDICADCAGRIDSLVELLQGRLSKGVMERICRQRGGLFPKPAEMSFSCTCLDHASMCKHVAAVLYGVGARLDHSPELLFRLRAVDQRDLLAELDDAMPAAAPGAGRVLASGDVSALFGLEMAAPSGAKPSGAKPSGAKPSGAKPPRAAAASASPKGKRSGSPAAPVKAASVNVKSLAAQLADSAELDRKLAEVLVAEMVALIADNLAEGKSVTLAGLGALTVREHDVRTGRNPATGEVIRLAGTKELAFRPASALKARAGVK